MIDISALLEEIKASPYRDITVCAPHTGVLTFAQASIGDAVTGPQDKWKEKKGTQLATLEREHNPKPIYAPEKGEISALHT
ncbi:MAG: biotin attachment protein, partial [Desulfovibrio sp.]|nr:biotin attachment protein [Desulfovibrio sp.]